MIFFVKVLSFTCWKFRPQTLAKSPAVVQPKASNLGSKWVSERVPSRRRKVAFESEGWSSKTDISREEGVEEGEQSARRARGLRLG